MTTLQKHKCPGCEALLLRPEIMARCPNCGAALHKDTVDFSKASADLESALARLFSQCGEAEDEADERFAKCSFSRNKPDKL